MPTSVQEPPPRLTLLRGCSEANHPLAEFKELGVQAIKLLPDGSVLALTSPDGKLYRIAANAKPGDKPELLFDAPKPLRAEVLWSIALDAQGNVLLATGAPAAIYPSLAHSKPKPELFFHSGDHTSVRFSSLMMERSTSVPTEQHRSTGSASDGKAYALYAAPRHEIIGPRTRPRG